LSTPTYTDTPNTLAIDASGNIWNANYTTSTLSEFSNLGVPISSTGYTVGTNPYAVAIDTSGNAWTTNLTTNNLSEVTQAGVVSTVSTANLNEPTGLAFDGSGNMYIDNAGANTLVKATSAGVYTTASTTTEGLDFPDAVALEPGTAGAVWATNEGSRYASFFTNAFVGTSEFNLGSRYDTSSGVAVDASGNAWVGVAPASNVTGQLEKVTTANAGTAYKPGTNNYYIADYNGVAVDGGGNIWSTDSDNGNIYEVSSAGTTLSGTYGFVLPGNTACSAACTTDSNVPQAIGIDPSGNVWYDMLTDSTLHEIVGAGVPTINPISATVKNSTIGTEP
jgi:streptogramin lyase